MTEPLDLEPIKARLAHFPRLVIDDRDAVWLKALIAEVERLRESLDRCSDGEKRLRSEWAKMIAGDRRS